MVLFKRALWLQQQVILMPTRGGGGHLVCIFTLFFTTSVCEKRSQIHVAVHFNYIIQETEKHNIYYIFIEIQVAILKTWSAHYEFIFCTLFIGHVEAEQIQLRFFVSMDSSFSKLSCLMEELSCDI
jgi:hypothetical protein